MMYRFRVAQAGELTRVAIVGRAQSLSACENLRDYKRWRGDGQLQDGCAVEQVLSGTDRIMTVIGHARKSD